MQLLQNHDIFLYVSSDGGPAFVQLFQSCWDRIPGEARQSILELWGQNGDSSYPLIELSDMWADTDTSYAQVGFSGMKMRFSAKKFAILPPSVARWIIAHELAHVYQMTLGRPAGGENEEENENHANEIAKQWRFDDRPYRNLKTLKREGELTLEQACSNLIRMGMG